MPVNDDVFAALANSARREVLGILLDGPRAAGEIAERFDMRRPSLSEHLRVLREAGLVREERQGRNRVYSLEAAPLRVVSDWLSPYERYWRGKLGDLRDLLDEEDF
ncbi:transcriptional regulator [Streptomyces sp. WAC 05977]|nr:transcriptional regulator [Streptomyces sp. WAC 05977]